MKIITYLSSLLQFVINGAIYGTLLDVYYRFYLNDTFNKKFYRNGIASDIIIENQLSQAN